MEGFLLILVVLVSALYGVPVPKEVICYEASAHDPQGFPKVVQEGDASSPPESADWRSEERRVGKECRL